MSVSVPALGVLVTTSEIPPPSGVPTNTGNAFVIGRTDWGPSNSYMPVNSMTQFIASCCDPTATTAAQARTTTNAAVYDAVEVMFQLGVPQIYVGRVVGSSPVASSLTLNDSGGHPTVVLTANSPGAHGNSIFAVVTPGSGTVSITLQDSLGNVLVQSPAFSTQAALLAWNAPYITLAASTASGATTNLPTSLTATALSGGTDDFGTAALSNWQSALNLFPFRLGPGQVLAPGQTNTTLAGIWSALLTHAATYNRFAALDLDSNTRAGLISSISTVQNTAYSSYGIFDQPTAQIPGVLANTTRHVAASAVRAGLCARVDANGNPNVAAAGRDYPLPAYIQGFDWFGGAQTSDADVLLLNQAGINTFELRYDVFESFGFSTPNTNDVIYFEAGASRLRMALVADAYSVGEPYYQRQIDGKGVQINAFGTAIGAMMLDYQRIGAVWDFTVDVGPAVNTPSTIAAGLLKAAVAYQRAPNAHLVEITLAAAPVNVSLP